MLLGNESETVVFRTNIITFPIGLGGLAYDAMISGGAAIIGGRRRWARVHIFGVRVSDAEPECPLDHRIGMAVPLDLSSGSHFRVPPPVR